MVQSGAVRCSPVQSGAVLSAVEDQLVFFLQLFLQGKAVEAVAFTMILVFGLSIVCSDLDILVSCFHMLAHEVRNLYQRGHNFCSTFQQGGFTTFYRLSVLVLEPPL